MARNPAVVPVMVWLMRSGQPLPICQADRALSSTKIKQTDKHGRTNRQVWHALKSNLAAQERGAGAFSFPSALRAAERRRGPGFLGAPRCRAVSRSSRDQAGRSANREFVAPAPGFHWRDRWTDCNFTERGATADWARCVPEPPSAGPEVCARFHRLAVPRAPPTLLFLASHCPNSLRTHLCTSSHRAIPDRNSDARHASCRIRRACPRQCPHPRQRPRPPPLPPPRPPRPRRQAVVAVVACPFCPANYPPMHTRMRLLPHLRQALAQTIFHRPRGPGRQALRLRRQTLPSLWLRRSARPGNVSRHGANLLNHGPAAPLDSVPTIGLQVPCPNCSHGGGRPVLHPWSLSARSRCGTHLATFTHQRPHPHMRLPQTRRFAFLFRSRI